MLMIMGLKPASSGYSRFHSTQETRERCVAPISPLLATDT
jgi:hypothetical protein